MQQQLKNKLILGLVLLVFGAFLVISVKIYQNYITRPTNCSGRDFYRGLSKVEIADTEAEREKGLMNRKELCASFGMLFVYEQDQMLSFWMKNTYVSLDMIFMDNLGVINTVHKNTLPLQTLQIYSSAKPSTYVLEVVAGFADKHNYQVGNKLDIQKMRNMGVEFDESY